MFKLRHSGKEEILPRVDKPLHLHQKKDLLITKFIFKKSSGGFALVMVLVLGMVMIPIAVASMMVAQQDRDSAAKRKESGASSLVSDSAISRAMIQLSKPNNGVLLNRNYDPVNPKTGKNYLGADGAVNSGDETTTALDEWTGYNPSNAPCYQQLGWGPPNIVLSGNIGSNESYVIRAYRYDKTKKLGTLLVEGNYLGQSSLVAITIMIEAVMDDFPGVLAIDAWDGASIEGKIILRGRTIGGHKGNVYYSPLPSANSSLTGVSSPGDNTRPDYLNAIWAGSGDGSNGDSVAGKIFACRLRPNMTTAPHGTKIGTINTSQILVGSPGGITYYQTDGIDLINNETLTVDTTLGPVYIFLKGPIHLHNSAKILNIRTDGQASRVGDLRLLSLDWNFQGEIRLSDQTCIQNAFVVNLFDDLELFGSGAGCPGTNANILGVVWTEAIVGSKNTGSNRSVAYYGHGPEEDTIVFTNTDTIIPGTSGIEVPEVLSSLSDVLEYIDWPVKYKYGSVKNWQRVN